MRGDACQMGSLAGAAHLLEENADVLRLAQCGQDPRVEHKGKSQSDGVLGGAPAGNRGLEIPRARASSGGGDRKVTTGITGLWRPSVRSDAAF